MNLDKKSDLYQTLKDLMIVAAQERGDLALVLEALMDTAKDHCEVICDQLELDGEDPAQAGETVKNLRIEAATKSLEAALLSQARAMSECDKAEFEFDPNDCDSSALIREKQLAYKNAADVCVEALVDLGVEINGVK